MWIEKTPSGKFKYVEQYTDYMTGKKETSFYYTRKRYCISQKNGTRDAYTDDRE